MHNNHIHPDFRNIMGREEKEVFLHQRSRVIWMTGLSGAGKSTIASHIEHHLHKAGFLSQVLDGDNIRSGINNNLGFSEADRYENIRRIAEVSRLFLNCGIICINSFISPTRYIRQIAYDIIGRENMIEIKQFTGIDSPFEPPENPDIVLQTDQQTIDQSIARCMEVILPVIRLDAQHAGTD
jgi:adenylylsulfate kinase